MVKKPLKRMGKQVRQIGETSIIAGGMGMALGGMGGASAAHGAAGVQNAMSYAPAMGSMIGAGALVGVVSSLDPTPKKKKTKRRY